EAITLIRPPSIDSVIEDGAVLGPVAARHEIVYTSRRTEAIYPSDQVAAFRFDDDVQNDPEMLVVEFTDRLLRIRKICWMPRELCIPRIPAGGSEAGTQINQRIARQFLFSEGPGDAHDLLGSAERSMRLHVTKRPKRRQLGIAGDAGVFGHDRRRVAGSHYEQIERQQFWRAELAVASRASSKVERAERLVNEHRPAICAHQPLDRNTSSMRSQLIAALSTAHRIDRAFAIELWPAFTETEQRTFGQHK